MCHLTLNSVFAVSFSVVSSNVRLALCSVELCHLRGNVVSFNVNYAI